jgi:tRNA A-37 threonylcarbamoyl transferase component Bud32/outer membrane protein assembly factor BamD (BamD/ComL family)
VTGRTISHYKVAEKLGEGATAEVYRADDLVLGREVVLKFFSHDGTRSAAQFQHEARTISSLNHPNICTIYEVGEHDGRQFLAMEKLDGQPLSEVIRERGLPIDQLVDVATQLAEALEVAHAEGIVHRDLKPGNIFVTGAGRVKLLDFGVALVLPRGATRTVSGPSGLPRAGTIPYMSPEQVRGDHLDQRTDLFSLGVVLYEMAAGRRPFVATAADEVLAAITSSTPTTPRAFNPSLPPELERIISKALEKSRTLRYQTAADLRADLQRLKRDLDALSASPGGAAIAPLPAERGASRASSRLGRVPAAIAVIVGCGIAGSGWFALGPGKARSPSPESPHAAAATIVPSDQQRSVAAAAPPVPARGELKSIPPPVPDHVGTAVAGDPSADGIDPIVVAQRQIDLRLYDQAVETLRPIARDSHARRAVDAAFMIASIANQRGDTANTMSAYLEIATRFPDHPRAPEALYQLAQSTVRSKRQNKELDAREILTQLVDKYPTSPWAPRALLLRGELEGRAGSYQRDDIFGGAIPTAAVTYRQLAERYRTSEGALPALQRLAAIYTDLKRFEAAASTLEELGRRDVSGRYDAWFAAGEIYDKRLKDHSRATAAYARVSPSSPHYAEAVRRN